MMTIYDESLLSNATNVQEVVLAANTYSEGLLLNLFMLAIFLILLMALKRWEFQDALLTSSFIAFVISGMLTYAGMVSMWVTTVFLTLTAFTGMYMYIIKRRQQ